MSRASRIYRTERADARAFTAEAEYGLGKQFRTASRASLQGARLLGLGEHVIRGQRARLLQAASQIMLTYSPRHFSLDDPTVRIIPRDRPGLMDAAINHTLGDDYLCDMGLPNIYAHEDGKKWVMTLQYHDPRVEGRVPYINRERLPLPSVTFLQEDSQPCAQYPWDDLANLRFGQREPYVAAVEAVAARMCDPAFRQNVQIDINTY